MIRYIYVCIMQIVEVHFCLFIFCNIIFLYLSTCQNKRKSWFHIKENLISFMTAEWYKLKDVFTKNKVEQKHSPVIVTVLVGGNIMNIVNKLCRCWDKMMTIRFLVKRLDLDDCLVTELCYFTFNIPLFFSTYYFLYF